MREAYWSSVRHRLGTGKLPEITWLRAYPGYQAGFILAIKKLMGGQEKLNDEGAVLGTPEPCHVLKDAEEKRGFICTSSMPSASSCLAKQTDETAFSGRIRGRLGRICL